MNVEIFVHLSSGYDIHPLQ